MKSEAGPSMKYDAGVDAYDLLTGRWSKVFVQSAIEMAQIGQGRRVLDVATGTGMRRYSPGAVGSAGYCAGLDVSVPMLKVAASKASADR